MKFSVHYKTTKIIIKNIKYDIHLFISLCLLRSNFADLFVRYICFTISNKQTNRNSHTNFICKNFLLLMQIFFWKLIQITFIILNMRNKQIDSEIKYYPFLYRETNFIFRSALIVKYFV